MATKPTPVQANPAQSVSAPAASAPAIHIPTREEEEAKLAEILSLARSNLAQARFSIANMGADMAQLYESLEDQPEDRDGKLLLHDASMRLAEMKRNIKRHERACHKPYFGRIAFHDMKQEIDESYYIGRAAINRNITDHVVIDWRAPVASVYYESQLGKCRYQVASEGTAYEVDLQHKRTYEIEADCLKDYFDTDVVANDDLLTKYLARNKKAVLGEIIATIQKEQNLIIRRSPKTNIIVQGCAGSGKTTVAMHRISYILYNYAEDFRPEDFYIIGSNRILLNYITSVLPDLDVYGIRQMTMEDLFTRLLYEDWDKNRYTIRPLDKQDQRNAIKGQQSWFNDLAAFCQRYEDKLIPRKSIRFEANDALLIGPKLIETYCTDNPGLSMQSKRLMLNEIIYSKVENEIQGKGLSFPDKERKAILRKYENYFDKEWKGSIYDLYQEFLQEQAAEGKQVTVHEKDFDVYDLAALAYLYKRIKETDPIREASHVIIDEAQDFGMMAYNSLHYCLRGCTYTIMGDTSQNIHYGYGLNDWEDLRKLILTGTYDAFGLLRKSYRNTVEIADYATGILDHGTFRTYPVEPILRHGDDVVIQECQSGKDLLTYTADTIVAWKEKGYETIAVICPDEKETHKVAAHLSRSMEVIDGTAEGAQFMTGVMVLPVAYTKGLEFDAVLIFNPTERHYPAGDGSIKLLYVAATRALHELAICHRGPLLDMLAKCTQKGTLQKNVHFDEDYSKTIIGATMYERQILTDKELSDQIRLEGQSNMAERADIGPQRLTISAGEQASANARKEAKASQAIARVTGQIQRNGSPTNGARPRVTRAAEMGTSGSYDAANTYTQASFAAAQPASIPGTTNRTATNYTTGSGITNRTTGSGTTNRTATNYTAGPGTTNRTATNYTATSGTTPSIYSTRASAPAPDAVARAGMNSGIDVSYLHRTASSKTQPDPAKAAVAPGTLEASATAPINPSPHKYGDPVSDTNALRPKGHSKGNHAIRWTKRYKTCVDLTSSYGMVRITPITDTIIRITAIRGQVADFHKNYWKPTPDAGLKWTCRESSSLLEIATKSLKVRVEKKNGAIQFCKADGTLLLTEKAAEPRQIEPYHTWTYFDWKNKERIRSQGILKGDLMDLTMKARYISFGGRSMKMPVIQSAKGYTIGIASEGTVLCNTIPNYETYISCEGSSQIDYYFQLGEVQYSASSGLSHIFS